ncbi:MAG: prepilin-type N-terminal cleavage/methylation domain-containing protein [Planctomycetota bacterium]|nr:MAG: prepilin-type N-terminal cleavage/methylation domain-containing protein [Planctomycetota bacterium]
MTVKRLKSAGGFTLVEVMTAIVILSVAVIGASGYRYYAALDARKAAMHTTASRIGLLLSESWRGVNGIDTYDPVAQFASELAINENPDFSEYGYKDENFTLLGNYKVSMNDTNYCAILSWRDITTGLRALNIVVVWPLQNDDLQNYAFRRFELTTYTTN